jgi:aminoglycoside phosphotransferase family enzyme/predicted kinase
MIDGDQAAALAFLRETATRDAAGGDVELIETHGAYVVLAGPLAYKMKRAVALPYMDFSTVARRAWAVGREFALNRRSAPGLYREVRAIVRDPGGRLAWAPAGAATADAVDWVLVMARFPDDALFTRLAETGRLDDRLLVGTAERVAELHAGAESRPDVGGYAVMARTMGVMARELRRFAGAKFDRAMVEDILSRASSRLDGLRGLLDRRAKDGRLRHGHGDLHLANICLFEDQPTPFDAIEFNDDFVLTDVLYDLAFLLMDLDHRGRRDGASLVLNRYLECTALQGFEGDIDALAALPMFLAFRAAIRGYVAATLADTLAGEPGSSERAAAEDDRARAYLARADGYLSPPAARLVAIGGVSGTGKSTLARRIAPRFGAAPGALVLRSDVIRKRLHGLDALGKLPPEAYAPEVGRRVQETIAGLAARALAAGHAVVVDQVHGHPGARARVAEVARNAGVAFDGLWLEGPGDELERRVASRADDASDATVEVVRQQLSAIEPPDDWHRLSARGQPRDLAAEACARLQVAWS